MYDPPKNQSNFDDVGDFHTKFGLESVTSGGIHPRGMTRELMGFRLNFMLEELIELMDAVGATWDPTADSRIQLPEDWNDADIDHARAFDALIDEVYVTKGFAHLLGYPWQMGWTMVQRANMRKERAERAEQSERGGTWDVVKPNGWMPPNIAGLLFVQGWDTEENKDASE